ncbi:hypothetical protein FGL86_15090 [Pistricoccus aurantiacus]|uniref:Uncharacterized protein n=1 Tax=Pistricoccus aurantiacus TaxID=1883414 RepID=A0A5B8SU73_9GAMM|nr:hypothetical protein [Pistricoccus aurantiacus]QEA40276.1 hypothetical protein FGL86_15090 [Pistricoccus aurantiacus]
MDKTKQTLNFLNEASNKIDNVSIIAMNPCDFLRFLARIYGIINDYKKEKNSSQDSLVIIKKSYQLLELILEYHTNNNLPVEKEAIDIFQNILDLLLSILSTDFNVNRSTYYEAKKINLFIRALRASGINPAAYLNKPFTNSFYNKELEKDFNEEALIYARQNIENYSKFIYHLADGSAFTPDLFALEPSASQFETYSNLVSLEASCKLLIHKNSTIIQY